jgi:hypothetical protein
LFSKEVIFATMSLSRPICLQAAKETGALQAAKSKLEKEVEELTWRLQLEKRMRVGMFVCLAFSFLLHNEPHHMNSTSLLFV